MNGLNKFVHQSYKKESVGGDKNRLGSTFQDYGKLDEALSLFNDAIGQGLP